MANKELYEGSIFAAPAVPDKEFLNDYRAKYNDENYMFGAVVGFLSFKTIVQAFENVKTKNEVADFMQNCQKIPTIFAHEIIKDKSMIFMPSALLQIKDNKLIALGE